MTTGCWTTGRLTGGAGGMACVTGCDEGDSGCLGRSDAGGVIGDNRIKPGRSGERTNSSRSTLIPGEGSESKNLAAVSGSFGGSPKPAGSISRTSADGV